MLQMLNVDHLGRVSDFVAVPGCGLKCNVSQIEALLNGRASDVQSMNSRNSTASFVVTYHIRDEAVDAPAVTEGQSAYVLLSFD